MFWVPCIRLDLPEGAGASEARWMAAAAEPILAAVWASPTAHLNVSVSAPCLTAFLAHGCRRVVDVITHLAGRRRIEILATPAHGALLPLLPPEEIDRQLALDEEASARVFGAVHRPGALWPTHLAVSPRVLEVAARREFEAVLVDERAMRTPDGRWSGERIDSVRDLPGLFLLPVSRESSSAIARGTALTREDLHVPTLTANHPHYRVLAIDVIPRMPPPRALLGLLDRDQTMCVRDVMMHFPKDHATSPQPCSFPATDSDFASGSAFSGWCHASVPRQGKRTELATELARALRDLDGRGLAALPGVRLMREKLDRAWRAERWQDSSDEDLLEIASLLQDVRQGLAAPAVAPPNAAF